MSNQIIAKPLALSGMEDPTVVFSSSADLDSLTGMLSGLTPTSDPGWESQLGYRGFFLEVDNVAPVGSELVRVWNGVVRIDQGSTRSFYVDSKGLEAWLLRRVVEVPGWTPIGLAALATLMIGTGLWWVTRRKLGGHIPA